MASVTQLEYATRPRRRFRHRLRWFALVALLAGALIAWRYYGRELSDQAKLRWAVHQCVTYTRTEDSIAYEANEVLAKELATRNPAYRLILPQGGVYYRQLRGAYLPAEPWESIWGGINARQTRSSRSTFSRPKVGMSYGLAFSLPAPVAPLFIHERECKGRSTRLVVIELGGTSTREGIDCYVIDPGRAWGKPALLWTGGPRQLGEGIQDILSRTGPNIGPTAPPARVFFGQVDPNNSAKFTIRVAVLNAEFRFEGRLMADDTIEIEGPLLSEVLSKISAANDRKLQR
jgi:hypothetical protein